MRRSQLECNSASKRMTHQMSASNFKCGHQFKHRRGQKGRIAAVYLLARSAVAGKVDGIDGMVLCERRLGEKPAIEIAAKAVNQDDGRAVGVTHLEVAHPPSADLGHLRLEGLRPAFGYRLGDKLSGELCDKGVDIGVRYF